MARTKSIPIKNAYSINKSKNCLNYSPLNYLKIKQMKFIKKNLNIIKMIKKIKSSYKKNFDYSVFDILKEVCESFMIELLINSKIQNSNQIKTICPLIHKREIIKTIDIGCFIDYVYKINIYKKEILLVFDNNGNIILYELDICQKKLKSKIFDNFNRILGISILENEMILILTEFKFKVILIEKDNFNNYCLFEVNDIININGKAIKVIKLQTNNILLLLKKSFSIYSPQKDKKERICYEIAHEKFVNYDMTIKKKLPYYIKNLTHFKNNISNNNIDVIELNKDIIIYYDKDFCHVYSIQNKQIIFSIKISVTPYIDDVLKKISDDIFCIGEKNIIEFISIKLGKVIDKLIFPNSILICAMGYLNDNNILIGSCINEDILSLNNILNFYQFKYQIQEKNNRNIFKVSINSSMSPGKGLGNIFIIELDDGRILITTKEFILFWNN